MPRGSTAPRAPRGLAARALLVAALLGVVAAPLFAGSLDEAKKALAARHYAQAAEVLAPIVEKDKEGTNKEAALLLATASIRGALADRLDLAEEGVRRLVKKSPDDADLRTTLGEVYVALARTRSEKSMEATFRDAREQFDKVLAAAPEHVGALVGRAQFGYYTGDFDAAMADLDKVPAGKASAAAHYWRGQIYYERAQQAVRADANAARAESTLALFRKSKGAYEAAAKADPNSYEAWMQFAYASQWVGDASAVDAALEGYTKAMGIDAENHNPLRGIAALKHGDDAGYVATLEKLAKQIPSNVAVHFALGKAHFAANRFDLAAKSFATYAERSASPGRTHFFLGQALRKLGKEKEALQAFEAALKCLPEDVEAADELDKVLREKHKLAAGTSIKAAKECEEDYERLSKLAPGNPFIPNNGAFILREAYGPHRNDGGWMSVLKASQKMYEAAAKIIDDMPADVVDSATWGDRYGWAQITSDTGLMFQSIYYKEASDDAKAEAYYLRALKLSDYGYLDAWNNLSKLYLAKQEWQKAYDLHARAAEGLATESQQPHTVGRETARKEMKRLLDEGKAKAE
jgi:tetratricopeptide (TPR) repeat protein